MEYSIRRRIANDDLSPDEAEAIEWERAEVETTEAVSMRGILVSSPDGIGSLRVQPDRVLKFRVFQEGERWVIGKMVHGSMGTIFDVVDDCRTEKFAQARCDALNAGIITP